MITKSRRLVFFHQEFAFLPNSMTKEEKFSTQVVSSLLSRHICRSEASELLRNPVSEA